MSSKRTWAAAPAKAPAKAGPDWTAIEVGYRAGIKTLRILAKEHGVSHVAIKKRADKEKWPRDLSVRIKERAAQKVNKAAVTKSVNSQAAVTEAATVEANAQLQATVLLAHRSDLTAARVIVTDLFKELSAVSRAEIQELLEIAMQESVDAAESEKRKIAIERAYRAAMDLPGRAVTAQRLVSALTSLIDGERTAFNIDERTRDEDSVVSALKKLAADPLD